MDVSMRPFYGDEASLFYSSPDDSRDPALGTVGHLRADFGHNGKEFFSSWWPHNGDRLNTPAFKTELRTFMEELRQKGPLRDFNALRKFCAANPEGNGFIAETENYRFCLRCTPVKGDSQVYLYAYDLAYQRGRAVDREETLIRRLDECLLRHAEALTAGGGHPTIPELHKLAPLISVHEYLTGQHGFDGAEVEALLRFEDPLEVIASCAGVGSPIVDMDICFYLERSNAEDCFPLVNAETPARSEQTGESQEKPPVKKSPKKGKER